jgi:hypothetical protein
MHDPSTWMAVLTGHEHSACCIDADDHDKIPLVFEAQPLRLYSRGQHNGIFDKTEPRMLENDAGGNELPGSEMRMSHGSSFIGHKKYQHGALVASAGYLHDVALFARVVWRRNLCYDMRP